MDSSSTASTRFAEYQKEEYKYVAEAHLKTIETISAFFRYYILLMSVPPSALALIVALTSRSNVGNPADILLPAKPLVAGFLCIAALVGFCMMVYIINLRMDVILYARAVNAIRKYFYDSTSKTSAQTARYRVLPQSSSFPAYFEKGYFGPVVAAFLLFDCGYLFVGLLVIGAPSNALIPAVSPLTHWAFWGALGFALVHVATYVGYAHHRESSYLRSSGIGVDIDGVLNEHQTHFCRLLKRECGKDLRPDEIREIPVHYDETHGISREDELRVFNCVDYWSEMIVRDDVVHAFRRLRNAMHMKIFIFTHRPFPDGRVNDAWREQAVKLVRAALTTSSGRWRWLPVFFSEIGVHLRIVQPMSAITAAWLRINGIPFDSLVIERGSENVPHRPTLTRNRFTYARKSKIRFFVEDDWEKASKLAHICDAVFLIDQPYNAELQIRESARARFGYVIALPANVIRVKSWHDVVKCVQYLN